MNKFGQQRLKDVESFLRRVPVFSKLDDRRLARLANGVETEYFEKGDTIMWRNERVDGFYIIDVGEVELHTTTDMKASVKLASGQFFGEK